MLPGTWKDETVIIGNQITNFGVTNLGIEREKTKSAVDLKRRFDQQWSICCESKNKIDVWDAVFDAKTKSGVYQY